MATIDSHPSGEQIAQFALDAEVSKETADHIASCVLCAKRVREIQKLAKKISQIPDEEIPRRLHRNVLQNRGGRPRRTVGQRFTITRLITHPVMLVILFVVGMVLLYAWYVFVSQ